MRKVYIHHHLGLGDHIICNGLVRRIAENYDEVYIFCKQHNYPSVAFLYAYDPKFKVIPLANENDVNNYPADQVIKIGFAELGKIMERTGCTWDRGFYEQFNVPIAERWSNFYVKRDEYREDQLFIKLTKPNTPYALIHANGSDNVNRINEDHISPDLQRIYISPEHTDIIFDYGVLIENANEIHCVDSSFKHLADSLPTNGKLFYHDKKYKRSAYPHLQLKEWIEV